MWFKKRKLNRLIQAKVTGVITPAQEEELNILLEKDQSKREDLSRLLELQKHLEMSRIDDMPIDVSGEVMQKISAKRNVSKAISPNQVFFENLLNPFPLRFAMILLSGIFIGTAITWIIMGEHPATDQNMISGTLSDRPNQGFSYSNQNVVIKMLPYQIDNIYYMNFIIDAPNEIQLEVSFDESELFLKKADYISHERNPSTSFDVGIVNFTATGKTSFQIILEKVPGRQPSVNISATQNQSVLIVKQIFID